MVPFCANCRHFAPEWQPTLLRIPTGKKWTSRCHIDEADRIREALWEVPSGPEVNAEHCCWDWEETTNDHT